MAIPHCSCIGIEVASKHHAKFHCTTLSLLSPALSSKKHKLNRRTLHTQFSSLSKLDPPYPQAVPGRTSQSIMAVLFIEIAPPKTVSRDLVESTTPHLQCSAHTPTKRRTGKRRKLRNSEGQIFFLKEKIKSPKPSNCDSIGTTLVLTCGCCPVG